jgi:hypothetical protein
MGHNRGNCFESIVILSVAFLVGCLGSGFSQTADEYFEQGKADLANHSLEAAHTNFQNALSLDANHEGANLFYALTSILMVSNSSEFNSLLDRAGVSAAGRDIFNWNADFARDAYGNVILPANTPTGGELQDFAQNSLLPVIEGSIGNLGKVGSGFQTYFNWAFETGQGTRSGINTFVTNTSYWSENEWVGYKLVVGGSEYDILSNTNDMLTVSPNLGVPVGTYDYEIVAPIEIDYGDALVIRAGLNLAKTAIHIFLAYDFNIDIDAIVALIDTSGFDIQTDVIQAYPQLLTLFPSGQLTEAKANFAESITQLTAAINFIVAEGDPQGNDLFVISSEDGAQFKTKLEEWNDALDGPTYIEDLGTQLNLVQFFDYPKNLRDYLPTFEGTYIKRGSFPDPTFGGIFPTMTATELYRLLEDWGLLVPVHITDFDGDSYSDITIWRSGTGVWYILPGVYYYGVYTSIHWGISSDVPVQGDYDGDGETDVAVWRPSTGSWFIMRSSDPGTYTHTQWGVATDRPVPGDYDEDGKTDIAVWRPSDGTWYILPSSASGNYTSTQWGTVGDVPIPADFDGDGKTDIAIWRPATGSWFILPSSAPATYRETKWGIATDTPVPGEYDGDGKIDIAVYRPSVGVWFVLPSSADDDYQVTQWGAPGDLPVGGDFDSDGITDIAVWRPSMGMWFIVPSRYSGFYISTKWGGAGDVPISPLTLILRSGP